MNSMSIKNLKDLKSAQCFVCVTIMTPFLTELSVLTKSGYFMVIVKHLVNDLIVMSPPNTSKNQNCMQKSMVIILWSTISVIHYIFMETNQSITSEIQCNQFANMHSSLQKQRPVLLNQHDPILVYDSRAATCCNIDSPKTHRLVKIC